MFVPFVFPCELLIDYLLQVLLMDRKKDFSLCCELKTFFFSFSHLTSNFDYDML